MRIALAVADLILTAPLLCDCSKRKRTSQGVCSTIIKCGDSSATSRSYRRRSPRQLLPVWVMSQSNNYALMLYREFEVGSSRGQPTRERSSVVHGFACIRPPPCHCKRNRHDQVRVWFLCWWALLTQSYRSVWDWRQRKRLNYFCNGNPKGTSITSLHIINQDVGGIIMTGAGLSFYFLVMTNTHISCS